MKLKENSGIGIFFNAVLQFLNSVRNENLNCSECNDNIILNISITLIQIYLDMMIYGYHYLINFLIFSQF